MSRMPGLACAAFLLLSACSINLPERVPAERYPLPAASLSRTDSGTMLDGLRIASPMSSDTLAGHLLLMQVADGSFQAHGNARWDSQLPPLWRDWLLDAFWRDGRVASLSASGEGLQARLELNGMLRAFHGLEDDRGRQARLVYDARLVDLRSRQIVASRRFEASEPLHDGSATSLVSALGRAANTVAAELIDWTVAEGSRSSAQ